MSDPRPIVTPQERAPLLARILARCEEEGDCLLWQGGCTKVGGRPIISFRSGCRYVRTLMYEIAHASAPPAGMVLAPRCRNPACVSRKCVRPITVQALRRLDAARGAYSSPAANAARVLVARRRVRIPEQVVQRVRAFEGTSAQAAQATGVSLAHTKAIRAGRARAPLDNPWRGLL